MSRGHAGRKKVGEKQEERGEGRSGVRYHLRKVSPQEQGGRVFRHCEAAGERGKWVGVTLGGRRWAGSPLVLQPGEAAGLREGNG